jgi:hypothetical protein
LSTSTSPTVLPISGRSVLIRWLVATAAFPVGGFVGHALGGPAATVPAAVISGLIAGAVIGLGQGLALGLRPEAMALWAAATAAGLGLSLAVVTAIIGQIDTTPDAVLLGAVSGLAIGAGQATLLVRDRLGSRALIWVLASGVAWANGWLVTSGGVGVALAAGWPVYGLSGAVVSQLITGIVFWKLISPDDAAAAARPRR